MDKTLTEDHNNGPLLITLITMVINVYVTNYMVHLT